MLGKSRVAALTPPNCNGVWGHSTTQVLGFSVYTLDGAPFTLMEVNVSIQHSDDTITNQHVWDGALGFDAAWAGAGSLWASPVMTMNRVAAFAAGDTLRFVIKARDAAANDSYMSWIVGIGTSPGSDSVPALGSVITTPDGKICAITSIEGAVGSKFYICSPCDHSQVGTFRLIASQLRVVGKRDRLDVSVRVTE